MREIVRYSDIEADSQKVRQIVSQMVENKSQSKFKELTATLVSNKFSRLII